MRSILLLACGSLLLSVCPPTYAETTEDTPWKWPDNERRDPFTFASKDLHEWIPKRAPEGKREFAAAEQVSGYVAEAEEALLALEPQKALATCEAALSLVRKAAAEDSEDAQRLACIRKAAEQMQRRQQAEAAFEALSIRISGAVCHGRKSVAIVNGSRVSQGDLVAVSEAESLVAEEIGADRITFVFRGFRFACRY
jgi:hypothetical protein